MLHILHHHTLIVKGAISNLHAGRAHLSRRSCRAFFTLKAHKEETSHRSTGTYKTTKSQQRKDINCHSILTGQPAQSNW